MLQNSHIHSTDINEGPRIHYHLENFENIFRSGNRLWQQLEEGARSFALLSTGYQTSQQKAILGLACYFDLKKNDEKYKIAIISHHLQHGIFSDFIDQCSREGAIFSFYQHFDFIDWNVLLSNSSGDRFSEKALEEYLSRYRVILWDLPELSHIEKNTKSYIPFLKQMDSLCILSSQYDSVEEENEHIVSYFRDYGVHFFDLGKNKSETLSLKNRLKNYILSFFT